MHQHWHFSHQVLRKIHLTILSYLLMDDHGRGGYIIFRRNGDITHPIFWLSRKLRRVARSSTTAEILSAADALDKAHYLRTLVSEFYKNSHLHCGTDSNFLFKLIPTYKEPEESSNKIDLASMREMFENGKLYRFFWIPGVYLIADALTKDNRVSASLLRKILCEGQYPRHPSEQGIVTPKRDVLRDMPCYSEKKSDLV